MRNARIRVLNVIAEDRVGGPHIMIQAAAKALKQCSIHTIVAMPDGEGDFAGRLSHEGIPFYRIRGMLRPRGTWNPVPQASWLAHLWGSVQQLRKIIEKENIDIVHQNDASHIQGAIAGRLAKRKVVWHVHGYSYPILEKICKPLVCRLANTIVASSAYTGRAFLGNAKAGQGSDFEVLYPPIDGARYSTARNDPALKRQFGFEVDDPVIATIGNINPLKGYPYFIRAASLIKRSIPKARFLVVGRSNENQQAYFRGLISETKRLGLEGNLIFTGFRDDIPELLSAIDVVVSSSLTEGLSLAIGEALAATKPVVATAVGGTPEIILDGETGILVPPKDPEALARAVVELLNDPGKAGRLATSGRERVSRQFSLQSCIARHEQIYRKVLNDSFVLV